jgi:hypothetical protein
MIRSLSAPVPVGQVATSAAEWLTPANRRVLAALRRFAGKRGYTWKTSREIADSVKLCPAAVSVAERRLEAAGLISRLWPSTNARRQVYFLRRARDVRLVVLHVDVGDGRLTLPASLAVPESLIELDDGGTIPRSFLSGRDAISRRRTHARRVSNA